MGRVQNQPMFMYTARCDGAREQTFFPTGLARYPWDPAEGSGNATGRAMAGCCPSQGIDVIVGGQLDGQWRMDGLSLALTTRLS